MPVKVYKPTSAGRRNASVLDFSHLTKGKRPEKSLTERLKKTGGRNAHGHITSRFRGGGARKLYRKVDFRRDKDGSLVAEISIAISIDREVHVARHPAISEEVILGPGFQSGDLPGRAVVGIARLHEEIIVIDRASSRRVAWGHPSPKVSPGWT